MGFACLYQAAAVMSAKRCRARLAFSNALARSGMGLTFLMAPFTQLLIEFYGWQGEGAPVPSDAPALRGCLGRCGQGKRLFLKIQHTEEQLCLF